MTTKHDRMSISMDEIDQMISDTMKDSEAIHHLNQESDKDQSSHQNGNDSQGHKRQAEFEPESGDDKRTKTDLDLDLDLAIGEANETQGDTVESIQHNPQDTNDTGDEPVNQDKEQEQEQEEQEEQEDQEQGQGQGQRQEQQEGQVQEGEHEQEHEHEHERLGHKDDNKPETSTGEDVTDSVTEPETATGDDKGENIEETQKEDIRTVVHQGIAIPADSELLNKSSAFTAYNELSSQLPTLPVMPNSHLTALPLAIVAADYLPPRIQLLVNTLPTLDNLATQVLRIFTVGPYQKIIDLVSNVETIQGASFRDLTSLFEFSKRLYSEDEPFLSVSHIAPGIWKDSEKTPVFFKSREQSIESTLRKTNLATFLLATLGVIEVGFFYLNESFLNIFCPLNNLDPENSLSNSNDIGLSLQGGGTNVVGDKIGKLLKLQAILYLDLKTQAYISAIEAGERSRKEILDDILPEDLEQILLHKRDVKALSATESDFIERCKGRRNVLLNYHDNSNLSEEYEWFQFLKSLFEFVSKNMLFLIWGNKKATKAPKNDLELEKIEQPQAEQPQNITKPSDITDTFLPSEILEQQLHVNLANKPTGRISNRRPWTREEEKALRHALEIKGPHWSSILELFGAGGKISEVLKNRTQVQLKDKARNWKMFFLKSGLPVPQYLQKVTGDLDREDKSKRAKKNAAAPIPNLPKK